VATWINEKGYGNESALVQKGTRPVGNVFYLVMYRPPRGSAIHTVDVSENPFSAGCSCGGLDTVSQTASERSVAGAIRTQVVVVVLRIPDADQEDNRLDDSYMSTSANIPRDGQQPLDIRLAELFLPKCLAW
jgi:hypothetical protein